MAQNVFSTWDRILHPYVPDLAEVNRIESCVQQTILGEIFGSAFFGARRKEAKDIESGTSGALSNIYSIIQVTEQRQKLMAFLGHMKQKLSPGDWKHLGNRLSSDAEEKSMQALFEIVILGNILTKIDPSRVTLNALTENGKRLDASISLCDRPIYLELTMLGEAEHAKRRRRQLAHAGYAIWNSCPSEHDGRRLTRMIEKKSSQFDDARPNVLAFQVFDTMNDFRESAADRFHQHEFKRIGLLLPFDRTLLALRHVRRGDPSCRLTDTEQAKLVDLLSGDEYFSIGYL